MTSKEALKELTHTLIWYNPIDKLTPEQQKLINDIKKDLAILDKIRSNTKIIQNIAVLFTDDADIVNYLK